MSLPPFLSPYTPFHQIYINFTSVPDGRVTVDFVYRVTLLKMKRTGEINSPSPRSIYEVNDGIKVSIMKNEIIFSRNVRAVCVTFGIICFQCNKNNTFWFLTGKLWSGTDKIETEKRSCNWFRFRWFFLIVEM